MKNILLYIMLFWATTLVAQTGYEPYTFEQLRAAVYTLPVGAKRIALFNCAQKFAYNDETFRSSDEEYTQTRQTILFNSTNKILSGVVKEVNASQYLQTWVSQEYAYTADVVKNAKSICERDSADGILVVSDFYYYAEKNGSLAVDGLEAVCSIQKLTLTYVTPEGLARNFEPVVDTLLWISTLEEPMEMPNYLVQYNAAVEQATDHIVELLVPRWEVRRRYALSSRNSQMVSAAQMVGRGDWESAKIIWIEALESISDVDRARAAINIGLYYEKEDIPKEAAVWFSKAIDIIDGSQQAKKKLQTERNMAKLLFERQMDRMVELQMLDKQMGG